MIAHQTKAQTELRTWAYDRSRDFELGVCLCFPATMKQAERGYDARWAQVQLSRFFNKMDRRLFGNDHKRRGVRLERLVVLEHAPNIGWHAHLAMPVPAGMAGLRFPNLIRKLWLDRIKPFANRTNIETYCWVEPITGVYADYALKWIDTRFDDEKIDDLSRCARFDEHNSHFANQDILPNEGHAAL